MSDLRGHGDLELARVGDELVAQIPLASEAGGWVGEFRRMAEEEGLAADVVETLEAVSLRVNIPLSSAGTVSSMLDRVLALVPRAQATWRERDLRFRDLEAEVNDWWTSGRSPRP